MALQPLAGGASTTLPLDPDSERYLGSTGSGIVLIHNEHSGSFNVDIVLRAAGHPDHTLLTLPGT